MVRAPVMTGVAIVGPTDKEKNFQLIRIRRNRSRSDRTKETFSENER